ncbi:MAG: hypothetical protein L6R37_006199 [Teloschistes peruensis]|nr:MAG: hypothetical protein L6R37_006199 [Teloschistes peruensis]
MSFDEGTLPPMNHLSAERRSRMCNELPPIQVLLEDLPQQFQIMSHNRPRTWASPQSQYCAIDGSVSLFGHRQKSSDDRPDAIQPWRDIYDEVPSSNAQSSARNTNPSRQTSTTEASLDTHVLNNFHSADYFEHDPGSRQIFGAHSAAACSQSKLRKASAVSEDPAAASDPRMRTSTKPTIQPDKRAAQADTHMKMERQRRQDIGNRTRDIANLIAVEGTKVEILRQAVLWIDEAKSRIAHLDSELSQLQSQYEALLRRHHRGKKLNSRPLMDVRERSYGKRPERASQDWLVDESAGP